MLGLNGEDRVAVIGPSCSGKTVFSQRLAGRLGCPHIELDGLFWGPEWTPRGSDEFRRQVARATSQQSWICDGNYRGVRDLVWSRATAVIWLNYSFPVVLGRALRRAIRRIQTGEELYGGNRESFVRTFLSRDSILLWVVTSFGGHRRDYHDVFRRGEYSHLRLMELKTPRQAEAFLGRCRAADTRDSD